MSKEAAERVVGWREMTREYRKEADEIQKKAEELQKKGHEKLHKSEHKHHQADRLDLGELGVELALVVCSVAILSKRKGFWYAGIALCAVGTGVAATAFLM